MTEFQIKVSREEALRVCARREEYGEPYEELLAEIAQFEIGGEVRWYESAPKPEFRGEVLEVRLIGFPEMAPGQLGIGYLVEFPGPEGVGREEHEIGEGELRHYESREPKRLAERAVPMTRPRLTTPERHQLRIARETLRLKPGMTAAMGGPTPEEAREIIKRLTGKEPTRGPA